MKKLIFIIIGAAFFLQQCHVDQRKPKDIDYTKFVNPFIGTGALDSLSLSGSNFPGACLPFGLGAVKP